MRKDTTSTRNQREQVDSDLRIPIDPEAERWCLASVLKDSVNTPAVFAIVTADDFVNEDNRNIARIVQTYHITGKQCDALAVKDALVASGYSHTEAVLVLCLMAQDVCTTAHAVYYARKVRDCAVRRRIQAACLDAIADTASNRKSAGEIGNELGSSLFEIRRDFDSTPAAAILPTRRNRR